jgi:hypothetical protein
VNLPSVIEVTLPSVEHITLNQSQTLALLKYLSWPIQDATVLEFDIALQLNQSSPPKL